MEAEMEMQTAIENMEKRFLNIRAGRANPAMLDGVMVNYYGSDTPLKQLATISIPEARQLMIKPFDKTCLSAIEKGIYEANIGLTPNNNGETIILNIPALTEEQEKIDLPDEIKKLVEERIAARENKNWVESDRIRDILNERGYQVKDTKEGMSVEKIC